MPILSCAHGWFDGPVVNLQALCVVIFTTGNDETCPLVLLFYGRMAKIADMLFRSILPFWRHGDWWLFVSK